MVGPAKPTSDRESLWYQWLRIWTRLTNISRHSIHHLGNYTCETSPREDDVCPTGNCQRGAPIHATLLL